MNGVFTFEDTFYLCITLENEGYILNRNNQNQRYYSDKGDIDELKELLHKQNELIGELSKRLDQQPNIYR